MLNYSFKKQFLPSKKIPHTDGSSKLIPKTREPLVETVIVSLRSEMEIKNVLYNTVKEQLVTLEEIINEDTVLVLCARLFRYF